jgi:hypothetical protein
LHLKRPLTPRGGIFRRIYPPLGLGAFNPMAVTQLKRKDRRNYTRANNKVDTIKRLTLKTDIKKVTVEELKAQFA